jgi:hypothetical protein
MYLQYERLLVLSLSNIVRHVISLLSVYVKSALFEVHFRPLFAVVLSDVSGVSDLINGLGSTCTVSVSVMFDGRRWWWWWWWWWLEEASDSEKAADNLIGTPMVSCIPAGRPPGSKAAKRMIGEEQSISIVEASRILPWRNLSKLLEIPPAKTTDAEQTKVQPQDDDDEQTGCPVF